MKWTAWNSGAWSPSGGGYGLRVPKADRDRHFLPTWTTVELELLGTGRPEIVIVNLSGSFWRRCSELRDQRIGRWLIAQGMAPWPHGCPPTVEIEIVGSRRFRVVT